MSTLTPISLLQEHCVHNALPLPVYIFNDLTGPSSPAKFECHCKVGNREATAQASSKKQAKHLVAEMLLQGLGVAVRSASMPRSSSIAIANNVNGTINNSIGKLNEYCSQNRLTYPEYYEMGQTNGQFVVKCQHKSMISEGLGSTKKNAKQSAAFNMLTQLQISPRKPMLLKMEVPTSTTMDNNLEEKDKSVKYSDDEIIKMYNEIISKRKHEVTKETPTYTLNDPFEPNSGEAQKFEKKNAKVENIDRSDMVTELESKLKELDIKYEINVVSKSPWILSMNTLQSTVLEMGSDCEEIKVKLLQKALNEYDVKAE